MRDPVKVSAEFAAFVWFSDRHTDDESDAASRFARQHWQRFLPLAHPGLGRLLLRIAKRRPMRRKHHILSPRRGTSAASPVGR
jgi:hypothetical protein